MNNKKNGSHSYIEWGGLCIPFHMNQNEENKSSCNQKAKISNEILYLECLDSEIIGTAIEVVSNR